jgi:glutamate--cysteine ligase
MGVLILQNNWVLELFEYHNMFLCCIFMPLYLQPSISIKYDQINGILNGLSERFEWVEEGLLLVSTLEHIYSWKYPCYSLDPYNLFICMQGKQNISLEPRGQFELSGATFETLHQTCVEVNLHHY